MTILMTADCMGGVWTYALDLIRALPQHYFVVATMGTLPTAVQRREIAQLLNATLHESEWKLEWMEEPWQDVMRSGAWLIELEREFSPDVVHLNGYAHAVLPFRAPIMVVAHSCVLSWWRAVKGEEAPRSWDYYRAQIGAGLRAADMVVSPTHALLDELHAIYGAFEPTGVIFNGTLLIAEPEGEESRQPFILCAGRLWDEAKNVAVLDQVAPRLSAPIRVAGAGDSPTQHLQLLGYLEQPALFELMEKAAIWAHPALYEPFGLVPLEAAVRGCTLVLSDIPTLRELWEGAALFVPPGDVEGWRSTLQALLDSPQELSRWAQNARQRAENYSLIRFAAAYDALYQQLA